MNEEGRGGRIDRRTVLRIGTRVAGVAVVLGALYVAGTFVQVWLGATRDDAREVDTLIVLGAAQYDGEPSPVLQGRLDHALGLWDDGLAEAVIVTGGKQEGDRFTEAFSGYEYLKENGVPEAALFLEVDGANTYEQLSASRLIMANEGWGSALMVSDPYHSTRLLAIAGEVGIPRAHVSPAPTGTPLGSLVRETVAVSLGRLVSYRRLGIWSGS